MRIFINHPAWGFAGRFTVIHFIVFIAISVPFQLIIHQLPDTAARAIAFYKPFQLFPLNTLAGELIRGGIIGLMLFPFRAVFLRRQRGWIILTGVLFGIILLGSVEPMPGSIEGVIYTVTSLSEHVIVVIFGFIHACIVSVTFITREKQNNMIPETEVSFQHPERKGVGYFYRFTLLHLVTYVAIGILFMNLQDYATAIEELEIFAMFRSLDDPMVAATAFIQIPRGVLLAFCIMPFHGIIFRARYGWLLLFGVMYVFTALASYALPSQLLMLAKSGNLDHILIGYIEITVQMGIFSWLLFKWEHRSILIKENR